MESEMSLTHFCTVHTNDGRDVDLEFDENGNLYIDKKRVVTESRFVLSGWQTFFGILASIGTFGAFIFEVLKHYCVV